MPMKRREFITLLGGRRRHGRSPHARKAMPVIGFLSSRAPGPTRNSCRPSGRAWARPASPRTATSQSIFAGRRGATSDCRNSRPIWSAGRRCPGGGQRRRLVASGQGGDIHNSDCLCVGRGPGAIGLVDSLNRPGGNLTGVSNLNAELVPKRLELLHEAVPTAKRIALLVNPASSNSGPIAEQTLAAARTLGLDVEVVNAREKGDLGAVFASLAGPGSAGW